MAFRWQLRGKNMRAIATLCLLGVVLRSEMQGMSSSHVEAASPALPPFIKTIMTTTTFLSAIMSTRDVHGETLQISEYQKLRQSKLSNTRTQVRRRRTANYNDVTRSGTNRFLGADKLKVIYARRHESSSRKKHHHHSKSKNHKNGKKKGKSSKHARYPEGLMGHPYYKHLVNHRLSSSSSSSKSSKSSKKHTPRKGINNNKSDQDYAYWYESMSFDVRAPAPSPVTKPTRAPTRGPSPSPANKPTRAPTPPIVIPEPCDDPELRDEIITERLREVSGNLIDNSNLPQGESADWIINDDGINQCAPNLEQRYALAVFYFATGGEDWNVNEGWLSDDLECSWFSIACDNEDTVTAIGSDRSLEQNNLSGFLPSELQELERLEVLQIPFNDVGGSIFEEIGELRNLAILDLEYNSFSSIIPDVVYTLTNLEMLLLGFNSFEGTLSTNVGALVDLVALSLANNNLDSTIPASIGLLVNMEQLFLYGNGQFKDILPDGIGNMRDLEVLQVYDNRLDGELPAKIFELENLSTMLLQENSFRGSIPDVPGLSNLQVFNASINELSGPLPENIAGWEKLISIDVNSNSLSDELPSGFYTISSLEDIFLHDNQFTGSLTELDGWKNAQKIWLQENRFSGSIPGIEGDTLGGLTELLLQENLFAGPMPSSICNLRPDDVTNFDLWADCSDGVPVQCSKAECCTMCFP